SFIFMVIKSLHFKQSVYFRYATHAQSEYRRTRPVRRTDLRTQDVSEGFLQIFRSSKTNKRQTQKADQKQIQWQSEKEKPAGRKDQSTFITRSNGNRLTTEALLLI